MHCCGVDVAVVVVELNESKNNVELVEFVLWFINDVLVAFEEVEIGCCCCCWFGSHGNVFIYWLYWLFWWWFIVDGVL